jgi:hypothetical protein
VVYKKGLEASLYSIGLHYTYPVNKRPISLLHSSAKLFEKVLLKRLNFTLKELNLERINMALSSVTEQRRAFLLFTDRIALGIKEVEQKFSGTESL